MNVLAIGNSFSQDATRYLAQIARADKFDLKVVNICIGGCPLERHYRNMLGDTRDYQLELNGVFSGFYTTIKEALLSRSWDVITLQQVSQESPYYECYQPYLNELAAYIRKYSPKAKLMLHQTWAYEQGSERLCSELGYTDHTDMFSDIKAAYEKAAEDICADAIIPSGALMQQLIRNGIEKVHRDTFHADFGVSRYAIGLLWYKLLSGNSIDENTFNDFDIPVSDEEIAIAKKSVNEIL